MLIVYMHSIFYLPSMAQPVREPVAAPYTRLSVYSAHFSDVFSFGNNQAALAKAGFFSAGIYGERRFMLQALASYQLAFIIPAPSGNFGGRMDYFGTGAYHESALGLAYGRSLGTIDIGAQFNYYRFSIAGYGQAGAVNFEGGAILRVSEALRAGFHFYNPTASVIGRQTEERLPAMYAMGLGYDVSDQLLIAGGIEKTEARPVSIHAGMQYAFEKKLFVRLGIDSGIPLFYFGLGVVLNGFRVDACASLHQKLGPTPGIMLIYARPEKK